jgi:diguanylate cyclase (GGDEF)-like protein
MNDSYNVLLIEDNPGDARLLQEMLAEDPPAPFHLKCADRLSRAMEVLCSEKVELLLLDLSLPDSHGLETFTKIYAHSPKVPVIVLTGNDDNALALLAVKAGAQDYLFKGRLDRELLVRSMQYSIERKRYQEELEHQANYDTLTGLPNRNLLHDRLRQAVFAQREAHPVAVVFLDLDHFKFVNDSLGHSLGDKLLATIAERLQSIVRDGDTVARLGGDEFVLILNDQTKGDVIFRVMQRILATISEPITIGSQELYITCSAGVSVYPQDGPDVESLLKNADVAMYRAKEHGRNNVQFYTSEMNALANERLALEHSLRKALDRNELLLHYQPKVSLATGEVVGAEALVRWQHPEWGLIAPKRFIPIAEETGLIVPIGEWVLRTACMQNQAWRAAGLPPGVVSVNVSARQFRQDRLVKTVGQILTESGMKPEHLEIELTESMVMHDAEAAIKILQGLKALGIALSVDDFGTGYSSLSYLRRLPLDTLKIDQSFVRDIADENGGDGGLLAQAIISLGHSLKLKITAEGVENDAQLEFLRAHHCDEVQGYYFSKPLPAAEFAQMLGARNHWNSSHLIEDPERVLE